MWHVCAEGQSAAGHQPITDRESGVDLDDLHPPIVRMPARGHIPGPDEFRVHHRDERAEPRPASCRWAAGDDVRAGDEIAHVGRDLDDVDRVLQHLCSSLPAAAAGDSERSCEVAATELYRVGARHRTRCVPVQRRT